MPHRALSGVGGQPQCGVGADAAFDRRAALLLADGLPGIEQRRHGVGLARIRLPLRARQPQRILRFGLVERVGDHRDPGAVAEGELELRIELVALRFAMVAVAVGGEVIGGDREVDAALFTAEFRDRIPGAIAAADDLRLRRRRRRPVLGEDRDHAARGIAVQGRERAAQDFDALRGGQTEAARLALPVGHRRRNAVLIEAYPAHAEARPRTEATRGNLQVLRVVPPVLHDQARNARERFGQVDLQLSLLDPCRADAVDGYRQVERALFDPRRRDDQRVDAHDVLRPRRRRPPARRRWPAASLPARLAPGVRRKGRN